jgi:hypothetical protein
MRHKIHLESDQQVRPPTFYCTHGPTAGRSGQSFRRALYTCGYAAEVLGLDPIRKPAAHRVNGDPCDRAGHEDNVALLACIQPLSHMMPKASLSA